MKLLLTVVTLLVVVTTKFHPSICFKFTSSPSDPLVVVLGRNSTNVAMGWQFTFANDDLYSIMKVFRFKKGITDKNQFTRLVFHDAFGSIFLINSSLYAVNVSASRGQSSGYIVLTIKDILRQPNNKDGSVFNPQSQAYIYRLDVTLTNLGSVQTSQTECLVYFLPHTPSIRIQPNQQVLCQGNTVNVTCNTTVGNPENTTLTFYRNNQMTREVKAGTLNGKVTKATVAITLTPGINSFRCQAKNLAGPSESTATVNVTGTERPVVTNCNNITVVEGTNLMWTCDASGGQPLTISWFKGNNNTVISSGKTLNITSIKRADAGMYRFIVTNGAECPTASTTVYLTVQSRSPCFCQHGGTPICRFGRFQRCICFGGYAGNRCQFRQSTSRPFTRQSTSRPFTRQSTSRPFTRFTTRRPFPGPRQRCYVCRQAQSKRECFKRFEFCVHNSVCFFGRVTLRKSGRTYYVAGCVSQNRCRNICFNARRSGSVTKCSIRCCQGDLCNGRRKSNKNRVLLRVLLEVLKGTKKMIDAFSIFIKYHIKKDRARFYKREIVSMVTKMDYHAHQLKDSNDPELLQAQKDVIETRMRAQAVIQKLDEFIDADPDVEPIENKNTRLQASNKDRNQGNEF